MNITDYNNNNKKIIRGVFKKKPNFYNRQLHKQT